MQKGQGPFREYPTHTTSYLNILTTLVPTPLAFSYAISAAAYLAHSVNYPLSDALIQGSPGDLKACATTSRAFGIPSAKLSPTLSLKAS